MNYKAAVDKAYDELSKISKGKNVSVRFFPISIRLIRKKER